MIRLGYTAEQKRAEVASYCAAHGICRVFVLGPEKFRTDYQLEVPVEHIDWPHLIMYRYYYRLLQDIDHTAMVVVDECLRLQNRHDLTYNCIRNYLQQTRHQIVFQYLPMIDTVADWMTLFDFDTRSRWKREAWRPEMRAEIDLRVHEAPLELARVDVTTSPATQAHYAREKRRLIDGIGLKDPHTIPRNLYLVSGKAKLAHVAPERSYVGRNNRFVLPNLLTYRSTAYPPESVVFELPHNFIDFSDFLALSRQTRLEVLVAALKVDEWYWQRYQDWLTRIRDAYAALHG